MKFLYLPWVVLLAMLAAFISIETSDYQRRDTRPWSTKSKKVVRYLRLLTYLLIAAGALLTVVGIYINASP